MGLKEVYSTLALQLFSIKRCWEMLNFAPFYSLVCPALFWAPLHLPFHAEGALNGNLTAKFNIHFP